MKEDGDKYIGKTIHLAQELCVLADEGEAESRDDGCMVLFGLVRDCGYKLRARAQQEKEAHDTCSEKSRGGRP